MKFQDEKLCTNNFVDFVKIVEVENYTIGCSD